MKPEPFDKYFGVPLSEWIDRIPNELDVDAVGLYQVVSAGRDGFDLSDGELRDFVVRGIVGLLERGALPVVAINEGGAMWRHESRFVGSNDAIAMAIVREWEDSRRDPDHDGLWFALPENTG